MKKTIRKILWRTLYKRAFIQITIKKAGPLLSYPMIVFISFEGEKLFIENGLKKFQEIMTDKVKEIHSSLVKAFQPKTDEEISNDIRKRITEQDKQEGLERKAEFDKCRELIKSIK